MTNAPDMIRCPEPDCEGGYVEVVTGYRYGEEDTYGLALCETCEGRGEVPNEFCDGEAA